MRSVIRPAQVKVASLPIELENQLSPCGSGKHLVRDLYREGINKFALGWNKCLNAHGDGLRNKHRYLVFHVFCPDFLPKLCSCYRDLYLIFRTSLVFLQSENLVRIVVIDS